MKWSAKVQARICHPPAPSPVSGPLDSVLAPGPDGGGESVDWFDDNDAAISNLLAEKNRLHKAYVDHPTADNKAAFYRSRRQLQQRLREMQDAWTARKAEEIEGYPDRNEWKNVFAAIKTVYAPPTKGSAPLLNADGSTLLTEKTEILQRWAEHFRGVLNRPSAISDAAIDRLPQVETNADLDLPPSLQETIRAVQQLSRGKARDRTQSLLRSASMAEDEIRRHLEFMEREASKLQSNVPGKKVDPSTRRLVRGASGEGGKTAWDERTVNGRQCQEVEFKTTRRARQVYRVREDNHQQLQRHHSAKNSNKNSARNPTASSRSYVIVENPSQLQKPRKTAPKPRRCPTKCTNRSSRARLSNEKHVGEEAVEGEDFVNVEGGEDDSETLAVRSSVNYVPDVYGESSDSSEDASWSPRNYFGYRGHLGIEFFADNAVAAMCAYPRNPLGVQALQKRAMSSGRNTIRF
ncbi:hypothetical protein SprV_0802591800 [Sparganum proliferum]